MISSIIFFLWFFAATQTHYVGPPPCLFFFWSLLKRPWRDILTKALLTSKVQAPITVGLFLYSTFVIEGFSDEFSLAVRRQDPNTQYSTVCPLFPWKDKWSSPATGQWVFMSMLISAALSLRSDARQKFCIRSHREVNNGSHASNYLI